MHDSESFCIVLVPMAASVMLSYNVVFLIVSFSLQLVTVVSVIVVRQFFSCLIMCLDALAS